MKYGASIFFMSGALVLGYVCIAMAIGGLRSGKVYHTSGCDPIVFKMNPVKFIVWTACLVGMAVWFLISAVVMAQKIMEKM